jgi:pyrroline-5-carboxylate reductase
MKNLTIGFIGAGNMANSLIVGLLASGFDPKNIWATNKNLEKLDRLKSLHIHTSTDNRLLVRQVDVVVLAVKPQILKNVVVKIADLVREKKPLLISIAAAINLKTLQAYLQDNSIAIVRCMPNTPALLGCGATGLWANVQCSISQKNIAESVFRRVGIVVWASSEKELDSVAALSGSGPAYFYLFIYALQEAGFELGLPKEMSRLLSLQTALGAARMAIESEQSVDELKQNVASPGGTTQAALKILAQGHFSELIKKAMLAARQRAEEMADQFENEA